ncbi:response regulator transcription factor [Sulfurospirillum multivorans]|uniref:Two-component regulator n=2 Tax=Sulfurospirillum multivorans TaxID=66821 RepID=A0AA86E359_SULMK|nr:response regulator transcription factor [Sulfurospirillum multivorans]AHJ13467.1 two-component regulator [Sulfurospirillum multivorans DSM 12446]QEH06957.1 two-component regulator [Sulfurospirillum multivorans]
MKILLLEDELMLRSSIEEYLEALGHKVIAFGNGEEAYEAIKKDAFDLLLLDINIPKMSGLNLLKALNEIEHAFPTIFISANVDIDDISQAFELGASDYLKKPFHLKELGLRIDKIKKESAIKNLKHIILNSKYVFSKEEQMLFYNNNVQVLTKKQLQIVTLLSENMGVVVDFEKFRTYVWNDEPIDNASIRAEISRFRKLLKEDFIINLKGVGYKIEKYFPEKNR